MNATEAELRNMVLNFRVTDLQVLLGFAGRNKTGKKTELQSRALDLLKQGSHAAEMKIRELDGRRYHSQIPSRSGNYELRERNDQRVPYDHRVGNAYENDLSARVVPGVHCAPINRPPAISHVTYPNYPTSANPYLPSVPNPERTQRYSSYVDVKFKELPFYDILYTLYRPSALVGDASERLNETSLHFTLNPQQAHDLAMSKQAGGGYDCQILLRFCLLDFHSEQEDNFPPNITVKVNGKIAQLPNPIPTNRPGVEPKRPSKPVNITHLSKLSPIVRNTIAVSWASTYGRSYAVAMFIVQQLTSSTLLHRLKGNGIQSPEFTTAMIRDKLQEGEDAEIATTNLRVPLWCPISKVRMQLPCRATTCDHVQCFEASFYIQMNEKKSKWVCPICSKPALFKDLAIDGLFMEIASKVTHECMEIEFDDTASWLPILPIKEEPKKEEKKEAAEMDVVDLLDDSDTDEEA